MSFNVAIVALSACSAGISKVSLGSLGDDCTEVRCQSDLTCAHDGTCQLPGELGTTGEGEDCSDGEECAYGLVCAADNTCVPPGSPGTGGEGDGCDGDGDCLAGHWCDGGTCADVGIPYWEGGDCPADVTDGDFYPLFDVPTLPAYTNLDFFSLPFPNDARLGAGGRPDLSGFPTPGDDAPAVDALLAAVEGGPTGWGTNPVVYFRFNRPQDFDTIRVLSDDATVFFASLDEDADDYGPLGAMQFFTRHARGKYVCQNWLAVSVWDGAPLLPDHTYAVWVTKGITDEAGNTAVRDNGFKVMVQDDRPEDAALVNAWDAYQPFRDYVAREGVDMDQIAGAAVFTTGQPARGVRYYRELVEEPESTPAMGSLEACEAGATTTCGACGDAGDLVELHGALSLAAWRDAAGVVPLDETGLKPALQGTEEACVAITLPPGEAPDAGWPVALVVPDVGGTFHDAVDDGTAAALAAEGVATISIELSGHGARGGAAWPDPLNPAGWLGGQLQSVADAHAIAHVAQTWSLEAADSPTGEAVAFDPDGMWFWGLGEGASVGIDFLAYSQEARGGVLGNPEGLRLHTLLVREEPVDLARGMQAAYADSNLTRWHPLVALHQQLFDPADPVNFALGVVREPTFSAKHLFVVHGVEDAELAEASIAAPLLAGSIPTAGDVLVDYGQGTTSLPASENATTDDGRRTAASVQVAAGHDALVGEGARGAAFVGSGADGAAPVVE
ncbi:MAG: hypothetical protein ACOZNI_02455 [Myxococcota bacterium]